MSFHLQLNGIYALVNVALNVREGGLNDKQGSSTAKQEGVSLNS